MMKHLFFTLASLIAISNFAQLPETFDLRDWNGTSYVSAIKSQEGGTCWTHAVMAAIEGNLMINENWTALGFNGVPNLSEYHLDWWNGFNSEFNQDTMPNDGTGLDVHQGGDYRVASAYLSRGDGAIKDTTLETMWYNSAPPRNYEGYRKFYVRDIEWYIVEEDLSNIDLVKTKIMEHGVMGTCMAYSSSFINGQYEHYQPMSSSMLPNHAVAIIGWDDTRVTAADEPGAWLVKNSWGSYWGDGGCFWISYYDKWSTRETEMGAVSFYNTVEPFFDTIYYHDYHGWRDTYTDVKTVMNAFTAHDDVTLKAVSFYTANDTVAFTVTIYDNFDGAALTNELGQVSGTINYTGLHTIDLEEEIGFVSGEDFYISLEFDKAGMPFDRTSEVPVLLCGDNKKTTVRSTSRSNQSFFLNDSNEWADFYNEGSSFWVNSGNFCIKAIMDLGMDPNGIKSSQVVPNVTVMPQPVKNMATIQLESGNVIAGDFVVTTIDGKLMAQVNARGESNVKIDMNDFAQGIYIYRLQTAQGFVTGKLVKQ